MPGYEGRWGGNQGDSWNRDVRQAVGQGSAEVVRKSEPGHGLKKGMRVFHTKFGEGTVQMLEGSGADAKAQINFSRHGVKWLALSVAKLTPID